MSDKYFADQLDDEEVEFLFRKHPVVMRKGLIAAMVCVMLGSLAALFKPEYSFFFESVAAGFVVGLIVMAPSWISWYYSVFIVTSQRFIQITQKGLFHRSVVDIGLNQIQMVNYEIFGLQETLLGFGTIIIQTYLGDLIIHYVHHPAKTQQKLVSTLRKEGIVPVTAPINRDPDLDETNN